MVCITSPSAEIVENIYLYGADRINWLALFGHVCKQFNWVCHAYCLMDNHYYIVEETAEGNLSGGAAVKWCLYADLESVSQSCRACFQGRYKAILVEKDRYLLVSNG